MRRMTETRGWGEPLPLWDRARPPAHPLGDQPRPERKVGVGPRQQEHLWFITFQQILVTHFFK